MKFFVWVQRLITVFLVGVILLALGFFVIPKCFGYTPYAVQTGSMTPKYPIGSMIYVKSVPFEALKVGDVITFESSSLVVTHRITQLESISQTLRTKGDANNTEDGMLEYKNVIGRATNFAIPVLGSFVEKVQTGTPRTIMIIVLGTSICVYFITDFITKRSVSEEDEKEDDE